MLCGHVLLKRLYRFYCEYIICYASVFCSNVYTDFTVSTLYVMRVCFVQTFIQILLCVHYMLCECVLFKRLYRFYCEYIMCYVSVFCSNLYTDFTVSTLYVM